MYILLYINQAVNSIVVYDMLYIAYRLRWNIMDEINGRIDLTLDKVMKLKNITKSRMNRETSLQYSQIKNYYENNMQKIDLVVLARLCDYLECDISDILKYTPNKK